MMEVFPLVTLPLPLPLPLLLSKPPPKNQRRVLGGLCAALLVTLASPSRAEDAAENVAAARTLGTEGVQLADAGKCPEAIEKLVRAEALHHAPTILGRLGECQVKVGQVVEGTENLNSVVREPLAANAPQVFRDAQERARKALAEATPKIAYLMIRITPADVKANVAVAGRPVPPALIGAERPTDPGTHLVTASAEGYQPSSATVTLAEGAHRDITLLLEKKPRVIGELPPPALTPVGGNAAALPPEPAAKRSNTPAFVALGVGAAGVVVGSVTGLLAFGKASDCPDKVCPTQGDLDSAKSMAMVSNVGFGVGIVGLAIGTVLLLTRQHEAAPAQAKVHRLRPSPQWSVQPFIGVSSLGVKGAFQ